MATTTASVTPIPIPEVKISITEPIEPLTPRAESKFKLVVKPDTDEDDEPSPQQLLRRSSSCTRVDTLPLYSPRAPSYRGHDEARPSSLCRSVRSEAPSYRTNASAVREDTIFHIYHLWGHYTVHTAPDSTLENFPQFTRTPKPTKKTPNPAPVEYHPPWVKTLFFRSRTGRKFDSANDPRMAKYFVHEPSTKKGGAPITVRQGPNRRSPVVCRIKERCWWKRVEVDFSDFNGEGIIDHRGMIAPNVDRGKPPKKESLAKKLFAKEKKKPSPEKMIKFPPAKQENMTTMTWKLSTDQVRMYEFEHRGVTFYWKGTQTTKYDKSKFWGPWCKYNHLKLVAELPHDGEPLPGKPKRRFTLGGQKPMKANVREVVVAVYTSTLGKRKCGRLAFKEVVIGEVMSHMTKLKKEEHEEEEEKKEDTVAAIPKNRKSAIVYPKPVKKVLSDAVFGRNRLEQVIVSTCIAMIRQERMKRQLAQDMYYLLLDAGLAPI